MLLMELNNFIILTSQYYFNQLYYVVHISINPRGEGGGGVGLGVPLTFIFISLISLLPAFFNPVRLLKHYSDVPRKSDRQRKISQIQRAICSDRACSH